MALFDETVKPARLAPSRRYSLALAHDTGNVSGLGHMARRLPPRKPGDPLDGTTDPMRHKPSFDESEPGHKRSGGIGKHPITGAPVATAGHPAPPVPTTAEQREAANAATRKATVAADRRLRDFIARKPRRAETLACKYPDSDLARIMFPRN